MVRNVLLGDVRCLEQVKTLSHGHRANTEASTTAERIATCCQVANDLALGREGFSELSSKGEHS